MADLLQRYGIKEVADVVFYDIDETTGNPANPVLVLDSLKVTSISQTAESADARGGKGNAKLISWDYGKEITIEIEDALFSPKSLALMFGTGRIKQEVNSATSSTDYGYVLKSARIVPRAGVTVSSDKDIALYGPSIYIDEKLVEPDNVIQEAFTSDGIYKTGVKWFEASADNEAMTEITNSTTTDYTFEAGKVYVARWYHPVANKYIIELSANTFPGTYYITGDTMIRSERTGNDEYFQFVIPKAKMQTEQTIEMQADGDPSTFNMSLEVLRPETGPMIKFIKYDFYDHEDIVAPVPVVETTDRYNGWFENVDFGAKFKATQTSISIPGSIGFTTGLSYTATYLSGGEITTITATATATELSFTNVADIDIENSTYTAAVDFVLQEIQATTATTDRSKRSR